MIAYNPGAHDKQIPLHVQSSKIEGRLVLLPPQAPWLEQFLNKVRRFLHCEHDDQIETIAQLLTGKTERTGELIVATYRT